MELESFLGGGICLVVLLSRFSLTRVGLKCPTARWGLVRDVDRIMGGEFCTGKYEVFS